MAKKNTIPTKNQAESGLEKVQIESMIYIIRETQVMIDYDIASLYGVENRSLKQAVRRNLESFPDDFMFRLSESESNELISMRVSQSVIPLGYNTGGAEMFAFTEQGVAMLATVLKSPRARKVSIDIMRAFVAMRQFLAANGKIFQRLEHIEYKLLEGDQKFDQIFAKLEERSSKQEQGIFLTGRYTILMILSVA